MSKQLSFFLLEIDREATKKIVEDKLEEVRFYKQVGFIRKEIKNTPSYLPRYHAPTNLISKPAEDVAVWNVDTESNMSEIIERVEKAVSRLSLSEKEIITKRYFDEDEVFDYTVYNELGYSERQYYRIKSRAFYKLAFMLKLEIYKEKDERV